jgi:phage FluMu protein Com
MTWMLRCDKCGKVEQSTGKKGNPLPLQWQRYRKTNKSKIDHFCPTCWSDVDATIKAEAQSKAEHQVQ